MKFNKENITELYNGFLIRFQRSGVHISFFMDLFNIVQNFIIMVGVFKWPISLSVIVATVLLIIYVVIRQIIGYIDIHSDFFKRQNSLLNENNVELTDINSKLDKILENYPKKQK